ncbi:phosphatidylglycerophosphate synthase [Catenulispora sp. EB89]|uniref:CDP-alcohol phosphatidyltransferase family protein n=1 Tax=Catenulispora sp. EB89 TaxID=3156257 RepID=UPI0035197685
MSGHEDDLPLVEVVAGVKAATRIPAPSIIRTLPISLAGFRTLLAVPVMAAEAMRTLTPTAVIIGAFVVARVAETVAKSSRGSALPSPSGLTASRTTPSRTTPSRSTLVADRAFCLAVLIGVGASHRMTSGLLFYLAVVVGAQMLVPSGSILGRFPDRLVIPNVVPLAAVLAACRPFAGDGPVSVSVEVLIAALLTGDLWFNTLHAERFHVLSWEDMATALPTRLRRNYEMKLERSGNTTARKLTVPNLVTGLRVIPAVAGISALVDGNMAAAAVWMVVFGLLDVADGYIARAFGQVTAFGTVLDVALDKTATTAAIVALVCVHRLAVDVAGVAVMRIAAIALTAGVCWASRTELPRNTWSPVASATVLLCVFVHSDDLALATMYLNVWNAVHFAHHAVRFRTRRTG